jgi:HEAT repeat protein
MSASAGLLVLGEPGAGKTTLLRWLAIVAAGGRFSLQTRLGLDERRLPLPVSVGRLAELRAPAPTPGFALDALAAYFADLIGLDVVRLKTFLERALSKGECLVLLDGLDEVGRDREAVIRWLEDLAFAFPKNRFVASSRIVGYQRMHLPVATEIRLTPFSDLQIERYLRGFNHGCLAQEGDPDAGRRVADRETDTLLAAIREIPRLAAVARNPFLLSALALIHRAEGQLPQHRIIFYQMVARTLCETWEDARRLVAGSSKPQLRYEDEALPILGELAIAMHRKHPTGAAPRNEVLRILANALKRRKALSSDEAMESAKAFLQKASTDVGLLCERGRGIWGFLHLTFQEFFVAAGLHARESFEREAFKNLFEPRWEEVIRLGIGYLAIVQVRPEAAARFVQKARQKTAPEYAAWISNVLQKQIPLAALLATEVGEALAAPIRRPILRDFIEWVWNMPEGPAGRFLREIGLNGAPEVRNAIAERLADSSPTIVARAAWAAGEHGDKALLPKIAELIRHSSSRVRISAVDAVARLGPESLTLELAARLKEDSSEEVRAACAVALGATGDKKVIPFLQSSLDDSDGFVVFAAAEAIAQIQPVLAWALKDPADPRRFVVPAFVNATGIGSDQDRKMLDTLTSDPDPEVRRVALRAIAVTRDDAFLPSVERASQDPDDFVRFWATTAIAWIKGKEALPVLNRALRDPSNLVRSAALRSLARLDSAGAFSALKESAEDKERFWMSAKVEVLSNQAAAVGVPCLLATLDQLGPDHKDRPLILEALWEFSEPGPMELSKVVVSRETAPT